MGAVPGEKEKHMCKTTPPLLKPVHPVPPPPPHPHSHGLCTCTAGAPPVASTPGYDDAAASLWTAVQAVGASSRTIRTTPTATVPVPPLCQRPANLGALKAAAAVAADRATQAEVAAQAAEAVAVAAAARAAAAKARPARPPPPPPAEAAPAPAAAPRPLPPPPPPAAASAPASTAPTPLRPSEADAAARAGARLQVKWTDGEWWDATVRPPPPLNAGLVLAGCARSVTLVYDTGEEEKGVDLAALAAKGEVTWLANMREWALRKVGEGGGGCGGGRHPQAAAAPPRAPPPPRARPPPPRPLPPPPPPAPMLPSSARVPISALVGLGPAVRGTRLRVLLAGGAALEVIAGFVIPGRPGLPVNLPDGRSVELLADRDGVDFAVYVA